MIWFTSDMHLGHEKALDFTCRPWNQIDEMNEGIIANINEKVKENDELYILGDYSFKITALEAAALRKKIYCKKVHLVPGNHDKDWNNKLVQGTFVVESVNHSIENRWKKVCPFTFSNGRLAVYVT